MRSRMKNNKNQDFESVSDQLTAQDIKEMKEKMLSSLSPPSTKHSEDKTPLKTRSKKSKEGKTNSLSFPFNIDFWSIATGVLIVLIIIVIILYFDVKQQEEKEKQKIVHELRPEPYDIMKTPNIRWV